MEVMWKHVIIYSLNLLCGISVATIKISAVCFNRFDSSHHHLWLCPEYGPVQRAGEVRADPAQPHVQLHTQNTCALLWHQPNRWADNKMSVHLNNTLTQWLVVWSSCLLLWFICIMRVWSAVIVTITMALQQFFWLFVCPKVPFSSMQYVKTEEISFIWLKC